MGFFRLGPMEAGPVAEIRLNDLGLNWQSDCDGSVQDLGIEMRCSEADISGCRSDVNPICILLDSFISLRMGCTIASAPVLMRKGALVRSNPDSETRIQHPKPGSRIAGFRFWIPHSCFGFRLGFPVRGGIQTLRIPAVDSGFWFRIPMWTSWEA